MTTPTDNNTATKNSDAPNGRRKTVMLAIAGVFMLAGLAYGYYYSTVLSKQVETDDAYVGGNLVTLTPQVSGTVIAIHADETQLVKAGQELIRLDPADAAVALKQAEAQLGETVRGLRQTYANVDQFSAVLAQRKVDLARAQDDLARRVPLLAEKAVSAEDVDHARQAVDAAKQALNVAEKQVETSRAAIDGINLIEHPSVLRARANFDQAYLSAKRNALVAPVSGYVAKRSVQVGQRITAGMSLLSVVPLDALWVDANFKEPELRNIRIGQPVRVETDIYGSKVEYHGKVIGLAAGTGSAFALLPAQNATGNWIKVVQRIPVRIALDAKELAEHPLRVGLSTTVTVDTHNRDGDTLARTNSQAAVYSTPVFDSQMGDAEAQADKIIARNAGVPLAKVQQTHS